MERKPTSSDQDQKQKTLGAVRLPLPEASIPSRGSNYSSQGANFRVQVSCTEFHPKQKPLSASEGLGFVEQTPNSTENNTQGEIWKTPTGRSPRTRKVNQSAAAGCRSGHWRGATGSSRSCAVPFTGRTSGDAGSFALQATTSGRPQHPPISLLGLPKLEGLLHQRRRGQQLPGRLLTRGPPCCLNPGPVRHRPRALPARGALWER